MKTANYCGLLVLLLHWLAAASSAPLGDDTAPFAVGLVCVPSTSVLNYVEQPVVRNDLKLTPAQQEKLEHLRSRLAEAGALAWTGVDFEIERAIELSDEGVRLLGRILTPEQSRRHSQIVLQHLIQKFGWAQIVGLVDVTVALDLEAAQSRQVQAVLDSIGYGMTDPAVAGPRGRRGGIWANGAGPPGFQPAQRGFRNPQAIPPQAPNVPVPQGIMNPGRGSRGRGPLPNLPDRSSPADRQAAARARNRERLFFDFKNADPNDLPAPPAWSAYEAANDQLSALFSKAQKQRVLELLGRPLAGRLSSSPSAVLRAPTTLLAFPRFAPRPLWQRSFQVGSLGFVDQPFLLLALQADAVRQELTLTDEQVQRLPSTACNPADVPALIKLVEMRLQPAQFERLKQIAWQFACRHSGPSVLFEFKEIVDVLHLSDAQCASVVRLLLAESQSTGPSVLSAIERNPDGRPEFDLHSRLTLTDILSPGQRQQLEELTGKPFAGALSSASPGNDLQTRRPTRSRLAPSLGYLVSLPEEYLESRFMQDFLRLSARQRTAMRWTSYSRQAHLWYWQGYEPPFIPVAGESRKPESRLTLLTPAQTRRYLALILQESIRTDGPAAVYRYRQAVEPLELTPEQEQKLLEALWRDTRQYLEIPATSLADGLSDLDRATSAALESVLSPQQRQTLAALLEEPAENPDAGGDAGRAESEAPETPGERPVAVRRLNYAVEHGSAIEVAEVLRERFPESAGTGIVVTREGNRLLISTVDPIFEKIVAGLDQLDRPYRTLIIDVLLVDGPLDEAAGADDAGEAPEDARFSGPIDQVTSRLNDLLKAKMLNSVRQVSLEVMEEKTGSVYFGRETLTIVPTTAYSFAWAGSAPFGYRPLVAGTRATIRARVAGPREIAVDLTLDDAQVVTPEAADEIGIGADGPLVQREMHASQIARHLSIPTGQAVVLHGPERSGQRVVIAARLAEDAAP